MAISVGSAVSAGFSLIGKRPLSVIGWGLFSYVIVIALLAVGVMIVGLPLVAQLMRHPATPPTPAEAAQMAVQFMLTLWPAFLIVMIGAFVSSAIVQAAAIRSVLRPDERAFASLRLGKEELALMLLYLVYIPVGIAVWLATAIVGVCVVLISHAIGGLGGGLTMFLLFVLYGLALMWLACRFALAAPMSFAEGRTRFFGSWALTRHEGARLFGLAWVMVLVWIGVFIAYYILNLVVTLVFLGIAGASIAASAGGVANFAQNPAAFLANWPIFVLASIPSFLLGAAFTGLTQAIAQGPWADAYRQLQVSPDIAKTFS